MRTRFRILGVQLLLSFKSVLCTDFTHLSKHKFRHGFRDTIDPLCKCSKETEAALCYLSYYNINHFIEQNS